MRILLVIESADSGAGRHLVDLAKTLVSFQHHVHLIYSPLRSGDWFERAVSDIDGLTVSKLAMQRDIGPHDLTACVQLRRLIRDLGPFDIIHGHSSKAGALVRLASRGLGAKLVYTPHALVTLDPTIKWLRRRVYSRIERVLAALGDAIICVSEEEFEHALAIGLPRAKCFAVNNGLGEITKGDRISVRRRWDLPANAVCAGFVGRISAQKAIDRLLYGFARIQQEVSNLYLIIVGDGPLLEDAKSLAQELGVSERTRFTGSANGLLAMSGFDMFVLPSVYEAFPYVLLEATANGLPIIATHVGGTRAVIDDGKNGFLFDPSPAGDLAMRLKQLSQDRELRNRMSETARSVAPRFTLEQMAKETVDVYESVLSTC